jgi:transposase
MGRHSATPHRKEGSKMNNRCIGIDVSKNTLDVHVQADGANLKVGNDEEGVRKLLAAIQPMEPELVALEATGGYEERLAETLVSAGLPVAVVNPARVRDFAKATGQLAKTDEIDARVIALFGSMLQPPKTEEIDETTREIKALNVRRGQLVAMRTAEKNRTEHARDAVLESVQAVIAALDLQIAEVEASIRELVRSSSELKQKIEIMASFPGIAEKTAAAIAALLPEIGTLDRKQIASLTGTAPVNRDSGQFRGKRMTGGGRKRVRTLCFMPTLAAIRFNPVIRSHYEALLSKGKEKMVAVVACMRKMFVILNAMVAKKQSWNPNFA